MIKPKWPDTFYMLIMFILSLSSLSSLFFVSGCATESKQSCNFIPTKPTPPIWVYGDNSIDNYYVGVGQAEKTPEMTPEKQMRQAKTTAIENLAQNIKVTVKSELNISAVQNEIDNKITFSQNTKSDLSTNTDITIYNIQQDALWLDQEKCILWIRIKVKKSLVDSAFTISQAESSYIKAQNSELPLSERRHKIEESIRLIQSVDFSQLPSSNGNADSYLKKYQSVLSSLESMTQSRRILYITNAPDIIQQPLINEIVTRLINRHQNIPAWYENNANCTTVASCMDVARENQAGYMTFMQIKANVINVEMGFWEGDMEILLSLYDVTTGQSLFQFKTNKFKALSYDQTQVPWKNIIESIFAETSFEEFLNALSNILTPIL